MFYSCPKLIEKEKVRYFPFWNFRFFRNTIMWQHLIIQFPLYHLVNNKRHFPGGRGGNTPIYGLYRYVLRDRVWFFRFSILKCMFSVRPCWAASLLYFATAISCGNIYILNRVIWETSRWGEVVAYVRWSQPEVWLYKHAFVKVGFY